MSKIHNYVIHNDYYNNDANEKFYETTFYSKRKYFLH